MSANPNAIASIAVEITGDFSPLTDDISSAVSAAQQGGEAIASAFDVQVGGELEDSLTGMGTAADAAGEQMSLFGDDLAAVPFDAAGSSANDLAEALDPLAAASDAAGEAASEAAGGFDELATSAGDAGDAGDGAAGGITDAGDAAEEAGANAGEAAGGGLTDLREQLLAIGEALVITEGIKEFGEEALNAADNVTHATIALTALTGSAQQANTTIAALSQLGQQDGLAMPSLLTAATRMQAILGPGANVVDLLGHIADGASVMTTDIVSATQRFDQMATAGTASSKTLQSLGLSLQSISTALNQVDPAADSTAATVAKMFKAMDQTDRITVLTTALQTMAGQAQKTADATFGGQWTQLANAWEEVMVQVGQALLPVISDLIQFTKTDIIPFVQELATWFGQLPEPVKDVAVALGLVVAAAAPVSLALSAIALGFSSLGTLVPAVTGALASLGEVIGVEGVSFGVLGTGIEAVGTAAATAAPLLIAITAIALEAWLTGATGAAEDFAKTFQTEWPGLVELVPQLGKAIQDLEQITATTTSDTSGQFADLGTAISLAMSGTQDAVKTATKTWHDSFSGFWDYIFPQFATFKGALKEMAEDLVALGGVYPEMAQAGQKALDGLNAANDKAAAEQAKLAAAAQGTSQAIAGTITPAQLAAAATQAHSIALEADKSALANAQAALVQITAAFNAHNATAAQVQTALHNVTTAQNALTTALGPSKQAVDDLTAAMFPLDKQIATVDTRAVEQAAALASATAAVNAWAAAHNLASPLVTSDANATADYSSAVTDAHGNLVPFGQSLSDVNTTAGSLAQIFPDLTNYTSNYGAAASGAVTAQQGLTSTGDEASQMMAGLGMLMVQAQKNYDDAKTKYLALSASWAQGNDVGAAVDVAYRNMQAALQTLTQFTQAFDSAQNHLNGTLDGSTQSLTRFLTQAGLLSNGLDALDSDALQPTDLGLQAMNAYAISVGASFSNLTGQTDTWNKSLQQAVKTIGSDMASAITSIIDGTQSWGAAMEKLGEQILDICLNVIIKKALQPVEDAISKLIAGTSSASSSVAAGGGGGSSGIGGMVSGVLGAVMSVISVVAEVVTALATVVDAVEQAHANTLLTRIEENTRYTSGAISGGGEDVLYLLGEAANFLGNLIPQTIAGAVMLLSDMDGPIRLYLPDIFNELSQINASAAHAAASLVDIDAKIATLAATMIQFQVAVGGGGSTAPVSGAPSGTVTVANLAPLQTDLDAISVSDATISANTTQILSAIDPLHNDLSGGFNLTQTAINNLGSSFGDISTPLTTAALMLTDIYPVVMHIDQSLDSIGDSMGKSTGLLGSIITNLTGLGSTISGLLGGVGQAVGGFLSSLFGSGDSKVLGEIEENTRYTSGSLNQPGGVIYLMMQDQAAFQWLVTNSGDSNGYLDSIDNNINLITGYVSLMAASPVFQSGSLNANEDPQLQDILEELVNIETTLMTGVVLTGTAAGGIDIDPTQNGELLAQIASNTAPIADIDTILRAAAANASLNLSAGSPSSATTGGTVPTSGVPSGNTIVDIVSTGAVGSAMITMSQTMVSWVDSLTAQNNNLFGAFYPAAEIADQILPPMAANLKAMVSEMQGFQLTMSYIPAGLQFIAENVLETNRTLMGISALVAKIAGVATAPGPPPSGAGSGNIGKQTGDGGASGGGTSTSATMAVNIQINGANNPRDTATQIASYLRSISPVFTVGSK